LFLCGGLQSIYGARQSTCPPFALRLHRKVVLLFRDHMCREQRARWTVLLRPHWEKDRSGTENASPRAGRLSKVQEFKYFVLISHALQSAHFLWYPDLLKCKTHTPILFGAAPFPARAWN